MHRLTNFSRPESAHQHSGGQGSNQQHQSPLPSREQHFMDANSAHRPCPKALAAELPVDRRGLKNGCQERWGHSNITKGRLIFCIHGIWWFCHFLYRKHPHHICSLITGIPEWSFPCEWPQQNKDSVWDAAPYQKATGYPYDIADVRENISALQQKRQVWTSGKEHSHDWVQKWAWRSSRLTQEAEPTPQNTGGRG